MSHAGISDGPHIKPNIKTLSPDKAPSLGQFSLVSHGALPCHYHCYYLPKNRLDWFAGGSTSMFLTSVC